MFKRRKVAAAIIGCLFVSSPALAMQATVTSNSDDVNDAGSLRAALARGANSIVIQPSVGTIATHSTLKYAGTKPLTIFGGGATIAPNGDFTALAITQGADLTVRNLDIVGIGGFSVTNQSTGRGKGIFVDIFGADQPRHDVVKISLIDVDISDVAYHGVHVSDCSIGDACGSGQTGDGLGTPASVQLLLKNFSVHGVGYGVFDGDGFRVDEREKGSISAKVINSRFVGAGADGMELDENGDGDVLLSMRNVAFDDNGGYCDPSIIDPNDPTTYADPTCVEDDDGELVLDLDDGNDIDEGGIGSVWVNGTYIKLRRNLDEGFDFDEAGHGDIELNLSYVVGEMNSDEGIKASEEDNGDIDADLRNVSVMDTQNNDGIELEETGNGDMFAELNAVSATGSGDGSGVEIVQVGGGFLLARVRDSVITGNSKDNLKVESFADDDGDVDGAGRLLVRRTQVEIVGGEPDIDTNVDQF